MAPICQTHPSSFSYSSHTARFTHCFHAASVAPSTTATPWRDVQISAHLAPSPSPLGAKGPWGASDLGAVDHDWGWRVAGWDSCSGKPSAGLGHGPVSSQQCLPLSHSQSVCLCVCVAVCVPSHPNGEEMLPNQWAVKGWTHLEHQETEEGEDNADEQSMHEFGFYYFFQKRNSRQNPTWLIDYLDWFHLFVFIFLHAHCFSSLGDSVSMWSLVSSFSDLNRVITFVSTWH